MVFSIFVSDYGDSIIIDLYKGKMVQYDKNKNKV